MGVSGGNINARIRVGKLIFCCGGTLGSLVVDKKGIDFILSNNHVLGRTNKSGKGDRIVQPGLVDTSCTQIPADTVAKSPRRITLLFKKGSVNQVDAAIAKIVSGDVDTDGDILNIGPISSTIDDPPALDQPVIAAKAALRISSNRSSSPLIQVRFSSSRATPARWS